PETIRQMIEAESARISALSELNETEQILYIIGLEKGAQWAIEEQGEQGWISCADRLPTEEKDTEDGDPYLTYPHPQVSHWRAGAFWTYVEAQDRDVKIRVTHWKHIGPLPSSTKS